MADDESKIFSLRDAERLRVQLEPILIEAIEARRKLAELEEQLARLADRVQQTGGLMVSHEKAAGQRLEHNRLAESVESAADTFKKTATPLAILKVVGGMFDQASRGRRKKG